MNSKYTGKLVEYLLDKISSLSSGDVGDFIGIELLDKFLRKDLDERTPHSLASDKKLEVGNFVSGTAGAVIYIDELTKHSVAEIDKLYVRLKAYFEQLEIINVNSVGGKLIISPAGGIKCSLVETYDSWGYYRCYFLSEQDGEKIENRFAVGDLAYSKTFNAREGSYNKISNRYYWRLVVGRGENYIDLSKTDCDADSDEPQEGDVIVHRGNRNDVDRLNCLEFSSVDSFSPSITLYQGINDYSLADKNVIQFGVEKSTGKAFMNVYGDMFIGNRDNSSYIRYSPEKGVEIKGKLDIGTSFGDKTLLDAIDLASTAYEEDLNNLKDIVNRDILNILNLLDGAIETWFYDPTPTLTNLPASLWTTESDRNVHLGDLYYSGAGRAYRFQYDADNSLYYWQEIVDTDIVLALENAKKAQDTADSKRKIFVRKPEASDSYDIGDMWVNATYSDGNVTYTEDLLRAILSKEIGEQFSITHWTLASKYTDDTVANDALQKATEAQNSVNELLNSVGDFKDYVDNAFLDGIIDTSEAQAIEKYINLLDTIKLQVDKSYEEIIKNSILENTLYLTNLNNSYTAFSSSYTELIDAINSAISDSKTTDLEKAAVDGKYKTFNDKYRDYTAYLNLAINYIEETINGKVERALLDIGGYKYLKAALLENTSIEGGLIQSSMLSLGYTKNNLFLVMAGTNGLVLDKGDRTIASWFGGGMIDMFDYYDSNTKTFNVPEDVRAAAGLDRMDGTGYRAKGNLWWDEAGVVHADPLSFFVGESTVGGLLASFLVVMKEDGKHPLYLIPQVPFLSLEIADYIRIGDALLKYDSASKAIYVTSADGTTRMGFYASGYVSALGKNSSGGSTGSASALYQLADVLANSNNDGVLNAANGSVLMYNGSKWQAGNVVTDISPLTLKVNGSSLFTYNGKSSITANLTVPTKVSQLTNDSGYLTAITKAQVEGALTGNITSHTHNYLPLSGGTLTGNGNVLTLNSLALSSFIYYNLSGIIKASTGYYDGLAYIANEKTLYRIGVTDSGNPEYWQGPTSSSTRYTLIHSGNYNSYALPLSGGTITGKITMSGLDTRLNWNVDYLNGWARDFIVYNQHNSSSGALVNVFHLGGFGDENGFQYAYVGTANYNGSNLRFNKDGTITIGTHKILQADNYNSYAPTLTGTGASGTWGISITGNAATATNADKLDGYHLTSSRVNPWNTVPIIMSDGVMEIGRYIDFHFDNTSNLDYSCRLQTDSNSQNVVRLPSASGTLALVEGSVAYANSAGSAAYVTSPYSGYNQTSGTITDDTTSDSMQKGYNGTLYPVFHNTDWGWSDTLYWSAYGMWGGTELATQYNAGSNVRVKIRKYNQSRSNWGDWTEFITSGNIGSYNAGSATKLQTPRTLWGQSFDGTTNISGDMTGVGSITRPARDAVDTDLNGNLKFHNLNSAHKNFWHVDLADDTKVLVVHNNGNVGIGDANPVYKLEVAGNCRIASTTYIATTTSYGALTVGGNIAATGAVTAKASSSDIRLKTDISDYKALSIIRSHKSIKYHWNAVAKANADIFNDDYWHYGLIAQDVQRDMPQMVSDVFKDYLVINYERLIPICWKGLQEVDDEVTKLKKKVRKLEMEIRELKQKEDSLCQ